MGDPAPLTVAELIAEPEKALQLSRPEAAKLLAAAMVRLSAPDGTTASGERNTDLLTARQAGALLGLTGQQVYRRADRWPFTRRLSPKTLRFDRAGLDLYLARNGKA